MSRRASLAVLLLGVLLTLPSIAHACPTDPVWIPGLYDDNDWDDVILFITGAVGAVDARVDDPIGPVVVCLGVIRPPKPQVPSARPRESLSARAPPQLSSWPGPPLRGPGSATRAWRAADTTSASSTTAACPVAPHPG